MSEMQDTINPLYTYVGAFIDELQRAGLHNVVICPGSRSTPLAMTIAAKKEIRTWMHIDERSAAFFGLGLAKRLAQPVALVCTSGTAAANFFPAIVEAKLTHIPLLILTADRPHELRENGAPQAIDQNRLYGTHVKWFAEAALPEATNDALRYIRTLADRAVALTHAVPAGPVHINLPFREPLFPEPISNGHQQQRDPIAWYGRPHNQPYIEIDDTPLGELTSEQIKRLATRLQETPRGLIVVGPYDQPALAQPLHQLAQRLGYPILADPLSQMRSAQSDDPPVISSYDAFLRLESFMAEHRPQLVLRIGAMPTAKPLLLYLKRYPDCPQIVIDRHGGWEEPTQLASQLIHSDPLKLCTGLLAALEGSSQQEEAGEQGWRQSWQQADELSRQALQSAIQRFEQPFEGRVFRELDELLPEGSMLFAGNSMPVRDMDTFFWGGQRRIWIQGNRGANGIDGIISSALGASVDADKGAANVLVIGDLSFFHDLNGLLTAKLHQLNLIIILINNDGGGIFSFLPQVNYPEHFEQLFGTPTGLDFRPAVEMYGGHFQQSKDWDDFREALQRGIEQGGLHVIEVVTERQSNVHMHRQLWQSVTEALARKEVLAETYHTSHKI